MVSFWNVFQKQIYKHSTNTSAVCRLNLISKIVCSFCFKLLWSYILKRDIKHQVQNADIKVFIPVMYISCKSNTAANQGLNLQGSYPLIVFTIRYSLVEVYIFVSVGDVSFCCRHVLSIWYTLCLDNMQNGVTWSLRHKVNKSNLCKRLNNYTSCIQVLRHVHVYGYIHVWIEYWHIYTRLSVFSRLRRLYGLTLLV